MVKNQENFSIAQFLSFLQSTLFGDKFFLSLIVAYHHDLENRSSKIEMKENKIKYKHNTYIEKGALLIKLRPLSLELIKHREMLTQIVFVKNLFYLDNKYYLDLLNLIILSLPESLLQKLNQTEKYNEILKVVIKDNEIKTEIGIVKDVLGNSFKLSI